MTAATPLDTLRSLARGCDPETGEMLEQGSLWSRPAVLEALKVAAAVLEERAQRPRPVAAGNIGQPWSLEEEQALLSEFAAGVPLGEMATRHQRSPTAIEARLERLGKITAGQRVTKNRYAPRAPGPA